MQKAASHRKTGYLVLGIVAILCTGCIVPSQQAIRTGDVPQESGPALRSGQSVPPQGLIKPTIPEERRHAVQPESEAQPIPAAQPEAGVQPVPSEQEETDTPLQSGNHVQEAPKAVPDGPAPQTRQPSADGQIGGQHPPRAPRLLPDVGGGQPDEKREWEDQKIKEAAKELAKNFPQVTKIKVCYSVKDDEWWVTLFDNAGAFTELKQYTWNRDLERLEVFLVLKRIPSSRVQQQLAEEEIGKACEILDTPNAGSAR